MQKIQTTEVEVTEDVFLESDSIPDQPAISRLFDRVSAWFTMFTMILLPFIIGFGVISIDFSKHLFVVVFVSLAGLSWIVARITGGRLQLPKSGILASLVILVLAFLPALLFSGAFSASFAGLGAETGTMMSIFVYVTLAFLVAIHVRSPQQVVKYLSYLLGVGIVVFLIQIISLFTHSFGFLGQGGSLVGKWNDTAVFYGLMIVLSLLFSSVVGVVGRYRILMYSAFFASLFGLILTGFPEAWRVVAVLTLVIMIAAVVRVRRSADRDMATTGSGLLRTLLLPAGVLVIALVFSFSGAPDGFLGSRIVDFQLGRGISTLEARPSWKSTLALVRTTYEEKPVIGVGLNRFSEVWAADRPQSINKTPFWNVPFAAGVGYLPTFAITAGILGLFGVFIFLGAVLVSGIRQSFSRGVHHETHAALLTLFVSTLYLLAMQIVYVTDSFLIALTFILLGLLVATGVIAGTAKEVSFRIFADARLRFVSLTFLVALFVLIGGIGYTGTTRALAYTAFRGGQRAVADNNLELANERVKTATERAPIDIYWRALANVETQRIVELLSNTNLSEDEVRARFQERLIAATTAAEAAKAYNEENFLNHLQLGRLYTSLVPLQFSDAYDLANSAYNGADLRAPNHPLVAYERARLERLAGNIEAALQWYGVALDLKPNYTEALFELSLIELDGGNVDTAIERAQNAATLSPNNDGIFFQLGFLLYERGDYRDAGASLERAVTINPNYANALYYLGLVYEELGFTKEALDQFERVEVLNPKNSHIKDIIANMRVGRSALRGLDTPTEVGELPIDESENQI